MKHRAACLAPRQGGLLSCGVADQGSLVGRVGSKVEGPNAHREQAPSVVKEETSGLLEEEADEKERAMDVIVPSVCCTCKMGKLSFAA